MDERCPPSDRLAEMSLRLQAAQAILYPVQRTYATTRAAHVELRLAEQALRDAPIRLASMLEARDQTASLAAFLPGNMVLYSTVLYALIPGEIVGSVLIRVPTCAVGAVVSLLDVLGPKLSHHIRVYSEPREEFADRIRDTNATLYCGSFDLAMRLMERASSNRLFMFVGSGVNPFIIMPDAHLAAAARTAALERSFNGGRDCLCPDVLFVHAAVLEPFVTALLAEVSQLSQGTLAEDHAEVVPLINEAAFNRTVRFLRNHAARITYGGQTDRNTLRVSPTIVVHPLNECPEPPEFSAPVWNIVPVDSDAALHRWLEADALCSRVHAVTFWTSQRVAFRDFYSHAVFNGSVQESDDGNQPFGGWNGRSSFVVEDGVIHYRPVLVVSELARMNRRRHLDRAMIEPKAVRRSNSQGGAMDDLDASSVQVIEVSPRLTRAEELLRDCWNLLCPPMWPPDELRAFDSALHRLYEANPTTAQHVLAALRSGRVVGMAVFHSLFNAGAAFCEYLAADVHAPAGTGRLLYEHVRTASRAHGATRLWVEYDDPASVNDEGRQRWAWYARRGVFRARYPYFQPSYSPAFPPKPMALGYDLRFAGQMCTAIEAATDIAAALTGVYRMAPEDPLLSWIANAIRLMPSEWLVMDDAQATAGTALQLRGSG